MPNSRGGILGTVRRLLPVSVRARLRGNALANWLLKLRYGGIQSVPHPRSPFTFYFDGMRNIGWASGSSVDVEGGEMQFVADRFAAAKNWRCAWDVGSNVGFWALFLAGLQPPIEQIICFEPDQINRQILEQNFSRNAINRATILPIGLSSHSGSGTFMSDPMTGSTGTLETRDTFIGKYYGKDPVATTIDLKTVDELIAEGKTPPDFMKIDVEGHELSVLEGAQQTLQKYRPMLMMEVTANAERVGQILHDCGYTLIDPETGKTLTVPRFATAAVAGG